MTDTTPNAFYAEYKPTVMERIWRALGWHYHLVELPETPEVEKMPDWAMTTIHLHLHFADRLRFLLTGRIKLDVRQKMDVPVAHIVSATSILILHPTRSTR